MRSQNELRPYQNAGVDFLISRRGAGLFLDIGLGKTATALTVISELRRFGYGPCLVLGPIRVIETVWRHEAREWEHLQHLKFSLVRGNEDERIEALQKDADIYLVNPDLLRWLFKALRKPYGFEILVVDESSMFKKAGAKRFRILRYKLKHFERRYILTGSPTPNRILEMWTQAFIMDLGRRLGTRSTVFKSRFYEPVVPNDWDPAKSVNYLPWVPKEGAEKKIYSLVADVILRIDAKDHLDLPEVTYNKVKIKLPPEAQRIYNEVEDTAFAAIDERHTITAANAAVALMKCRQIANGIIYVHPNEFSKDQRVKIKTIHKAKLDAVGEILDETSSPVIVVYNFVHELKLLQKSFPGVVLSESKDISKTVRRWNAGRIPILYLHPMSGGHGLNLQYGGHTMVWLGLTFSYEQWIQTVGRINRQGQKYPVMIHIITALKTIDIMMGKVLKGKAQKQGEFFDYLKLYREQVNERKRRSKYH
jgi:SNF2 family DNA or RNA helicase